MRLIDADALLDKQESLYMKGNVLFHGVTACAIENAPTIDPETLPFVQELRAQVKEQKERLAHLEYWELDRKQVLKSAAGDRAAVKAMQKHCEKTISDLRAELKRVTAERDAAIKDRAELADFELTVCEQFCFGDRKHDIPPCEWNRFGKCQLRKWRGLVAENATAESEPKPQWKELATLRPLEGVGTKEGTGKNHAPGYPPQKVYCADCKNPNNLEKCLLAGQEKPISTFCSGFEPKENANEH